MLLRLYLQSEAYGEINIYRKEAAEEKNKNINDVVEEKVREYEKLRKNSLLILSDIERRKIDDFKKKHYNSCKKGEKHGAFSSE